MFAFYMSMLFYSVTFSNLLKLELWPWKWGNKKPNHKFQEIISFYLVWWHWKSRIVDHISIDILIWKKIGQSDTFETQSEQRFNTLKLKISFSKTPLSETQMLLQQAQCMSKNEPIKKDKECWGAILLGNLKPLISLWFCLQVR